MKFFQKQSKGPFTYIAIISGFFIFSWLFLNVSCAVTHFVLCVAYQIKVVCMRFFRSFTLGTALICNKKYSVGYCHVSKTQGLSELGIPGPDEGQKC